MKEKPNLSISIVDELPEVGQEGILYLVPSSDPDLENAYDEYVWLPESESFELVGSTAIDLSNMVTTDTEQTISGSKTFTSPIIVGASGYDIKKDGSNIVIEADGNDIKVRGGLTPNSNATYSIGTNSLKWSNMHLNNSLLLGNNTTAGQGQITFKNPDLTNQGNWYIYSPDQNSINFMQDTQNTGVRISRGTMYPLSDAYFTLGSSSFRWKTINLSHYVDWGNGALLNKDSSNRININYNSNPKVKVGNTETYFANHVEPDSPDTYDLGRSGMYWRNAYIKNIIKGDGTSIATNDIATKTATEAFSGTFNASGECEVEFTGDDYLKPGMYLFTYSYAQAFVYIDANLVLGSKTYGIPIRAACPVYYNTTYHYAVPGNLRIDIVTTETVGSETRAKKIKVKVSDGNQNAAAVSFKFFRTGLI